MITDTSHVSVTLRQPSSAVVSLVLGLLGLSMLPVVGSILALGFGHHARREATTSPDLYTDDVGRIGRILGWVGLGLAVFGFLAALGAVRVLVPVSP